MTNISSGSYMAEGSMCEGGCLYLTRCLGLEKDQGLLVYYVPFNYTPFEKPTEKARLRGILHKPASMTWCIVLAMSPARRCL